MKRQTAIIILLTLTSALCANAQSAYEALLLSENNYEGTARTVAMGNAFTALGGDLGAVTINPAGSAVAKYSQFSITPSLTISSTTSHGVSPYSDGNIPYFQNRMRSNMTRFSIPNFGLVFNWDTNRKNGLKNMTFGFVASTTNSWNEDVYATGENHTTSFMGALAVGAEKEGLESSWLYTTAYESGMISPFGSSFVGASEQIYERSDGTYDIALGGPIDQIMGYRKNGSRQEYIFNVGANFSDFIYIGANIGISSTNYTYSEYFKERAQNPEDFPNEFADQDGNTYLTYFQDMKYQYNYEMSAVGFFVKLGVIATPVAGLRLGAAIQTPILNNVNETWRYSGQTIFSDSEFNASATSDYGESSYTFTSPFRANFGAAYTFGKYALISADYEICDYSQMKYGVNNSYRDYFEGENADMKARFTTSHMFRFGVEGKPIQSLAIRAGYNMTSAPEVIDGYGLKLPVTFTHNVSAGVGFSSKGSFFADLALKKTFLASQDIMPYQDYIVGEDGKVITPAPLVNIRKSLWKVLLTVGWRF